MAAEQQPLDITAMPDLVRLVDEVRTARRPRVLRRANEDVALLVPLANAVITPVPYNPALAAVLARLPKNSVTARTAGMLHTDQPFPGYEEEEERSSAAIAADIVANWERA